MAETRYFLKYIDCRITTPLITDELWEEARLATLNAYERSQSLIYLERCLELFEQISKTKYFSDLKEFIFESSVEDFCDVSGAEVIVSTIHKAKGREFDDVYMLIADGFPDNDYLKRRYYVGITRAKNRLFIHTNGSYFNHLDGFNHKTDLAEYEMPDEIVLQLSHKDVFLNYFKERKQDILRLRSGDKLVYRDNTLYSNDTNLAVAKLSLKMKETLSDWENRGYKVTSASVRFIVAWKPKDAEKKEPETAVILADLKLGRVD